MALFHLDNAYGQTVELHNKHFFNFIKNNQSIFQSDYHFAFPPVVSEISSCCLSYSIFIIDSFFHFSYSNICVVVSDYGLNLHYSDEIKIFNSFHVHICHFIYLPLLKKCLFKFLPSFKYLYTSI